MFIQAEVGKMTQATASDCEAVRGAVLGAVLEAVDEAVDKATGKHLDEAADEHADEWGSFSCGGKGAERPSGYLLTNAISLTQRSKSFLSLSLVLWKTLVYDIRIFWQ